MDDSTIRRIASYGLGELSTGPTIRPREQDWSALLAAIVQHRLTGLAVAAVDQGSMKVAADQEAQLLDRHREAMLCALALERNLFALASALDDASIRFVVLKGPAVAHVGYPDPSWRPFGDIDVLVPTDRFDAACGVLSELGYRRTFVDPRPGFAARFGKGAAHVGPDGLEMDLHRLLADGPFGYWVDHDAILRASTPFELGGRSFARLNDTALVLHACLHAVLGGPRPTLLQIRDIAQLSARDDVRWDVLAGWGRRWRLRAVLGRALHLVERQLGDRALPQGARDLLRSMRPSVQERRVLRACAEERFRGEREWASLRALPGVRAKVVYAGALVFPGREFLRARTGSDGWRGYVQRWRTPVGWVSARPR